jgi:formate dehydrogenase subunit delta
VSNDGTNKLVRMANQIADNFDYGSDKSKASASVLDHLTRFWTPAMKQSIVEQRQRGDIGLNEIADAAVKSLADKIGQPA